MGPASERLGVNLGLRGINDSWETSRVACLADIPLQHLNYHASSYGRVAIGFKRQAAISEGFVPVLYCSDNSTTMLNWLQIKRGISLISSVYENLESFRDKLQTSENNSDIYNDLIRIQIDILKPLADYLPESVSDFEKIFKNYSHKGNHPANIDRILNEREWRCLHDFEFSYEDIAMIIVPQENGVYERLLAFRETIKLPHSIPIVPWETLNIS